LLKVPGTPGMRWARKWSGRCWLAALPRMCCRGRGGVHGMGLGSVAQALLHHAPCLVVVIRPPAGADHGSIAVGAAG
jgi:hypothetical protein